MNESLAEFRHAFPDGMSADDARAVLPTIGRLIGLNLVAIWSLHDEDGFGGDVDLYVIDGPSIFEAPADLFSFLFEGEPLPAEPLEVGLFVTDGADELIRVARDFTNFAFPG